MRRAGVLLPVFSLPGTLGIGDLGLSAYTWVDMLFESGASLWQILPLNPVGYGNSPYQTYSSFAGDEIYISIEDLYKDLGLEIDIEPISNDKVDYEKVISVKESYLKGAYKHFSKNTEYKNFIKRAYWLDEYVEFITLKKQNMMKSWLEWADFKLDESQMDYERFVQYIFDKQWHKLKNYANNKEIQIVGDLPIYLGHDSAEVYNHPELFTLNKDGSPRLVAGVPPDYFSETGQLWGNPLYDWIKVAENNYKLWIDRLSWNQSMFDVIRLDHFRAFDTFWVIDAKEKTAKEGEWRLGPAHSFFNNMYKAIPNLNIVVEDLGELRPEVLELRDDFNLMGMRIIQFALEKHEMKKNKNLNSNLLAYTGTHDNPPIKAIVDKMSLKSKIQLSIKLPLFSRRLYETISYYCLSLNSDWAFLPVQDILGYGEESRLNIPGTVGSPNWQWKLKDFNYLQIKMQTFKKMVYRSNRNK